MNEMKQPSSFVHLHVHSEYSLLDGAARIRDLAARAAQLGMRSLALTDHGVMYGAVPFYKACKAHGIKPIIGCELYVTTGSRFDKGSRKENPNYHLTVLAKNEAGYRNLMKLCSIGHLEGFHYKPRVDMESLKQYAEGLICLSGCMYSEVSQHLLYDRRAEALSVVQQFRAIFQDDYYIEIQDHGLLEQKKVTAALIELAKETGIKLAATNDVHYLQAEDAAVQEVLLCIGTGKTMEDEDRMRMQTNQLYMKSADEMAELFQHVPEAVSNTEEIAQKCSLELKLGRAALPVFKPVPEGMSSSAYLEALCQSGLEARYAGTQEWVGDSRFRAAAEERLKYELSVIESMGFSDYFLIVWDFIRFAHERSIRTGPGRGSSAGSLVAYTLRITDVDPIKYKLLFERFLNPERITMPDIDIDFNDERRDEVIQYVSAKYGEEHVAQIITFGTMAAKAAVRDVGRALNLPYQAVDKAAKLIPNQLGITLAEALEQSEELRQACETQPRTDEMLRMAMKVEGMPRHASTHAAGVVISEGPLTDYVPLQAGSDDIPLTQYSMENLEAVGLLKMDFLGLRTLSIVERTLKWVKELYGREIDFRTIDDADPDTYAMLGRGETTGIFQLESTGVRRVLRELKPSVFEDIISVLALYRPGPMEFIPKYIQGKHGLIDVEYPHPSLEPIVGDTYGIIVYQEQIMQIASLMAGFSLGEADLLRRAVSKKKREVLDEERSHFVRGSLAQGYSEVDANNVYDMIVRFADYGFPRAHAAAYGVLAFQTAWLKMHYPVPFMASMLASVTGNQRKTAEYVDECRRMGMQVLPPDVNESGESFTPVGQAVRFGLAAIKNVGTQAIEAITRERSNGPFDSLLDLCCRVDLRVVNKRVLESLIQGGACDSLPGHRAQQLAALDETVEAAVKWRKEKEELQIELFGFDEVQNWDVELPDIQPFTMSQVLELERELLGLYLSGHPLDAKEEELAELGLDRLVDLSDAADGTIAMVAAMVVSLKPFVNKKGNAMAFLELEDRIMRVEAVVFPAIWKRCSSKLDKGGLVIVQATVQQQEEDYKLLVEEVIPLSGDDAAIAEQARRLQRAAKARTGRGTDRGGARGGSDRSGQSSGQGGGPRDGARGGAKDGAGYSGYHEVPLRRDGQQRDGQQRDGQQRDGQQRDSQRRDGQQRDGQQRDGQRRDGQQRDSQQREPQQQAPQQQAPPVGRKQQRVYIKISAENERPAVLAELRRLLASHAGQLETVLFYEREGRSLALSKGYNVKPSAQLTEAVEQLLGQGTIRIK